MYKMYRNQMTVHNSYQIKRLLHSYSTQNKRKSNILLTLSKFLQNNSYWRTMKYLFTNNVAYFFYQKTKNPILMYKITEKK